MFGYYKGDNYPHVFQNNVPVEIVARRYHNYLCRKHMSIGGKPMAIISEARFSSTEMYINMTSQELIDNRSLFIWIPEDDIIVINGTENKDLKSALIKFED